MKEIELISLPEYKMEFESRFRSTSSGPFRATPFITDSFNLLLQLWHVSFVDVSLIVFADFLEKVLKIKSMNVDYSIILDHF